VSGFVHLHVHSHYSLLDGAATVNALVGAAVRNKMSALALTDHGNMFGAIEFYRACIAAGIKPLIGYEAYVAPGSRLEKTALENESASYHLTLLVRDMEGYRNLVKLASEAYLTGFYYKPRIDDELLRAHSGGLIALSGCAKSRLSGCIMRDDFDGAERVAREYSEIFGDGNFFIELQDHGIAELKKINEGTVEVARRTGLPTVVTNDVHYIAREDAEAQDVLICINTGKLLDDEKRLRMDTDQLYFKSEEEMAAVAAGDEQALTNTAEIASRCNLELDFETKHFPRFVPPEGKTIEEYFEERVWKGYHERFSDPAPECEERLKYELDTLNKIGLASYLLIVWDFIRYARENRVPVGPGRGSACGSLVAYCLRITDVDPIRYNIIFERFADINRREMPDIDTDFCVYGRESVINYVSQKYGRESVAQIITFGTMAARGAIRDVGRVLNIPLGEVDSIAKKIPPVSSSLTDAIEADPDLKQMGGKDARINRLFKIAKKLEGLNRHASIHAAGVVMADGPLTEYLPLYKSGDDITSQYAMKPLEQVGLVKMDFLGLRTLTVLDKAVKLVKQTQGIDIDLAKIPLDDAKTFELLRRGGTKGVFQVESPGFRDMMMRLKPDCIEDIIVMVALYRPGPLGGGMVDEYIHRKHGKRKVKYLHPLMEEPLKETYGVMVYQGQIMQLANRMAGFSMADALTLIKAIGKKKQEFIEGKREEFIKGCIANKVPKKVAEQVFDLITFFGGYGFPKGHATAYALITYQTAYMKANFPVEFMAALLTCEMGNTDKIVEYTDECARMGIKVEPPDVNEGFPEFTVADGKIRFGLVAVKNVGQKAVEALVEGRDRVGRFENIYQFCENVDLRSVNKATVETLVKSGAFDFTGWNRAQMATCVDSAIQAGGRTQEDRRTGQMTFLGEFKEQAQARNISQAPDVPDWPETIKLKYEKESLGFYVTSHPLAKHRGELENFSTTSIDSLKSHPDGQQIVIGCMLHNIKYKLTRAGNKMAQLNTEDLTGNCRAIVFPKALDKCGKLLEEDSAVFLRARVDNKAEEPCLIISEIIPIEKTYERLARIVNVTVDTVGLEEETLSSLREIVSSYQGDCPVYMHFKDGSDRTSIRLGRRYYVLPSRSLVQKIAGLLGDDCVAVR